MYIALFSHFIPCGAYEGVYILDPFYQNKSDIQPTTVHADTHGHSASICGLAYILGIQLMPRIRKWEHLVLYRPSKQAHYQHIDSLFSGTANWDLIANRLPDMLRVGVSIAAGTITPSTILRSLARTVARIACNRPFASWALAVRTAILLQYVGDAELRSTIQAATNKSESFNDFVKWLAFGGGGVIGENDRGEQRKIIKYNHLLASCLIFHNVCMMTRTLHKRCDTPDWGAARREPLLTLARRVSAVDRAPRVWPLLPLQLLAEAVITTLLVVAAASKRICLLQ